MTIESAVVKAFQAERFQRDSTKIETTPEHVALAKELVLQYTEGELRLAAAMSGAWHRYLNKPPADQPTKEKEYA